MEAASEMGKSETEAAQMFCLANNDLSAGLKLLGLEKHEYIEYYMEELSKEVRISTVIFIGIHEA